MGAPSEEKGHLEHLLRQLREQPLYLLWESYQLRLHLLCNYSGMFFEFLLFFLLFNNFLLLNMRNAHKCFKFFGEISEIRF